jgi:hypothetical protein
LIKAPVPLLVPEIDLKMSADGRRLEVAGEHSGEGAETLLLLLLLT